MRPPSRRLCRLGERAPYRDTKIEAGADWPEGTQPFEVSPSQAATACRTMGFNGSASADYTRSSPAAASWMDELECDGTEPSLSFCSWANSTQRSCDSAYAYVVCTPDVGKRAQPRCGCDSFRGNCACRAMWQVQQWECNPGGGCDARVA